MSLPTIVVTMGDPSGIGPEVTAKALAHDATRGLANITVIGKTAILERELRAAGSSLAVVPVEEPITGPVSGLAVMDMDGGELADFPVGSLSRDSGRASHAWVVRAANLCLANEVDAMVTAPVNKEAWRLSGVQETGHQEVLQRMAGSSHVTTMLVSGQLRCMHLSTHKPLKDACAFVTRGNVLRAILLTHEYMQRWGFATPRIAVAALNPHASDNGLIGSEEATEIAPAIADARAAGVDASGPLPADSVFNHAIDGRFDVVVVMYHDQGHIAIKVHGFEESITVNLGLPFIRTSVDHGTAFDIAGKGVADATSMVEAIRLAANLATGSKLSS